MWHQEAEPVFLSFPSVPQSQTSLISRGGKIKTYTIETPCLYFYGFPPNLWPNSYIVNLSDLSVSQNKHFICLEKVWIYSKTEREVQRCPIYPHPQTCIVSSIHCRDNSPEWYIVHQGGTSIDTP